MIYLDYSANTPADPDVLARFVKTEQTLIGNANAAHPAGTAAKAELDRISSSIASLLHVKPSELIYTSGASESNNLAIKGITRAYRHSGKHIISTMLEHASVSGCLTALQEQGYEIDLVDIGRDGKVDLAHFRELLRPDTVLAAVCAVDSELGTIQPIQEIASILKVYPNCHFHVDATQAIGKTAFSFDGIDTVSFAPHKFYGINGSGVLFKKEELVLEPLINGGTSTSLYRSGTPALGLAASTELALEKALGALNERSAAAARCNQHLREAFSHMPSVQINSPEDAVPHILNISVQGIKGAAFQAALAAEGVCVSVKSACSVPGTPSKPVFAITHDRKRALSSWRISLSHLTTEDELDEFLRIFARCQKAFSD